MNKLSLGILLASLAFAGCNRGSDSRTGTAGDTDSKSVPRYTFITNGVADFWTHAQVGANTAGKELGVNVDVIMPSSLTDQTRKLEDLLIGGVDGVAISAIDPENQAV